MKTKTHCKSGHEFTVENTYYTKEGWKQCKICRRISGRKCWLNADNQEKYRRYRKEWRSKNKETSRKLARDYYDRIRTIIEEAKRGPCVDCGQQFPHYVMDLHHRAPETKRMNIGRTRGIRSTPAEIAKCDLLCANCHRIRTWRDKGRKR